MNTGADRGIGYETARALIAGVDNVWLGCRDGEGGKRAADELGDDVPRVCAQMRPR